MNSTERTSLVRANNNNRDTLAANNSSGDDNNGHHHNNNYNGRPPRTQSSHEEFSRRDPRTLLAQVQHNAASFQAWAAKVLHAGGDSSKVHWVQNARVARTFAMIINGVLAILSLILIGVEMVEMVVREPILDYLLPESEISLFIAGLAVVAGALGFAVAYNLLVDEDSTRGYDDENGAGRQGNGSGGSGGNLGPRRPTQNNDPPAAIQQTGRPKLIMFTRPSTYLLTGNAVLLLVLSVAFIFTIVQRSAHLSQMDKELNSAWTDANRHRTKLISDFELRHQCCGYTSIADRPFPPKIEGRFPLTCSENDAYGFQVPCKANLAQNFGRWQKGIQHLLLAQLALLLPLLALIFSLSAIGIWKLKEQKQQGLEFAEAQTEATAAAPVVDERAGAQFERPRLEDVRPHHERTPLLVNLEPEPVSLID
ncbi:hypothetical protein BGZ72_000865 [Mortierella alpina]|nr:hypothetical protein BGZ72_000865 [Mortierella alpina]